MVLISLSKVIANDIRTSFLFERAGRNTDLRSPGQRAAMKELGSGRGLSLDPPLSLSLKICVSN